MTDRRIQRLDQIAEILADRGSLRLKDAAELLSVSEMTVRRDISAHPDRFGCFGGHIVASPAEAAERSYVLDREREAFLAGVRTTDFKEGASAFLAKRPARFEGR